MSHPLQISHQVSITTSLLPDECASPHGNTSPATPKNLIANPLLPDDDAQDDSDTPFDYDLLLPPPNPLPKKAPPTRDPLQILFEYPLQKAPKFSGKEVLDPLSGQESNDTYKNSAKVYSERIKEAILAQSDDSDENREYKRLCDYFMDEEKIVYRRRPQAEGEEFNQTIYNIKTQPRRNMEDSEVGIETNFGENMQTPQKENILRFESRFESGNLSMASMVSENEYNLLLQSDINTYGFGQWFFFAVMNNKKNQTVKFNILNYRKTSSLHNLGMRVLVYSSKEAKKSDIGWSRTSRADYFCNNIPRENPRINNVYRTLSFEYTFKHNADCVFFSYSMPYTYSNLQDYLDSVEMDEIKSRYFGRSTLCRTLAGNKCELVTITQKTKSMDCDKKKCIFLTARVHPGETNSSFVIQGVMDFLLSNCKEAESLREKFIFKIIPMLNPDGVIHGNSRCCLIGSDLNRKWKRPSPKLQPTIYNAKVLASELHQKYGVILYCDFHGHSKKRDTFIYGCQEGNMPLEVREFAFVLGKVSPMFCYRKSSFFMESTKAGTARIALYQEFKIKCSYTLEASFFGPEKTGKPYSLEELFDFGGKFCKAILLQFSKEGFATKKSSIKEIDQELAEAKQKMIEELYSNQENLMNNEPDSGSESELSEDELPRTVIKDLLPKMRKRPPPLKKQPSKTPQKLMKSTMAPLASGSISSTVQVPSSAALVGEAKILKLSFDRTPLRERYFSKVKSEKFAFPQREAVYITSPGPEAHQDKSPEILDNFCFVVRKLEGKFEPKNETRRQLINTYQEGFLTPDVKPVTYESLATQEKRLEKDKEKEERFNRLSKDKRRAGNLIEAKRPGTLSVVNTIKKSFPNLIDRGSPASLSTANLTTTSLSTLKHVRSLKELKSVRDLRIIENGGETENIEDFYPNTSDEIKDMMQNIKDILDGTATTKETRELKDIRDSRDTRDLKDIKDIRTKDPQGRELSESQSRSKIKKTRAAYTLEPIGKATIMNSFEKLDTDPRFKTNTKIKHPGFQRRSEEDGTIMRESLKEYSREGQKSSFSSIRELLNPGFKDQFSGLDRWRYNVMIADDQGLKTAMGSPKKMNTQDKDTAGDELQMSVEYATPHRRIKKVEGIGRMNNSSRKQFPNASARTLDIKNSTSLANTLSKVDLSVIQTVSRHKSPLKS